jgi:hypothetical protein
VPVTVGETLVLTAIKAVTVGGALVIAAIVPVTVGETLVLTAIKAVTVGGALVLTAL